MFSSATITLPANETFLDTGYLAIASVTGALTFAQRPIELNFAVSTFIGFSKESIADG